MAAEEEVKTVRETASAERTRSVRLVQAREQAEQEAIGLTVAADAEKQAAEDRAAAQRLQATGEADAVRIRALADEERYRVEAEGQRAINQARNALSAEQIALEVRLALLRALPEIVEQSVKPMERIDNIKIIDVRGLGGHGVGNGVAGEGGGKSAEEGGLARSVVDQALRYRAQRPLVDALLKEVGLSELSDLSGLASSVTTTPSLEGANGSAKGEETVS